jgi:hypothetical protein
MICAFDTEAVAIIDAAGDIEDLDLVEEVGAGETKAVVAVGLGEAGLMLVIVDMVHIVIG